MRSLIKSSGLLAAMAFFALTRTAYAFMEADAGAQGQDHPVQAEAPKPLSGISGKVVETMDAGGYTYVQLENEGQRLWVAVPQMKVKAGEELVFKPGDHMLNFKSETLKRTFDVIVFSPGPYPLPGTKADRATSKKAKGAGGIKVDKAAGPGAYTVAEIYGQSAALDKKQVTVSGKVVKVSVGIMDTNWVHLQDGTGEADKGNDNLVVTTMDQPAVGDVVTATGTLAKDKDFGYGYKYDVILEKANIKK